ncbi:MAG: ABC transporter ATP-binding protein/permease [Candidatus Saccharibacteria bacterium]|nr:ABC transporter ATP-binding protein/permease [Candidatus Saccharibacteria bacterium]
MGKSRTKGQKSGYNAYQILRKSIRYCNNYRVLIVCSVILCLVGVAVSVSVPLLTSQIILRITDGLMQQVILTALVVLLLNLFENSMRLVRTFLFHKLQYGTLFGLQQALVRETLGMEVSEIDKNGTGKIIERLTSDADKISSIFADYAFWLIYLVSNIGVVFAVLVLSREMFILSIIIAIACFWVSNIRIKNMNKVRQTLKVSRDERSSMAIEIVRGIRDIKTLNAGGAIARNVGKKIREAADYEDKIRKISRRFQMIECSTYNISEFVFLAAGCALCSNDMLTIPAFIIAYNYLNRIRDLFYGVARIAESNKEISLSGNRIFEIVEDRTYRKEHFGTMKIDCLEGDILFKHVSFSYNKKPVIKDLNMHIAPNEKVAIVGKSGSGKTTIMNLITRIYDIDSGDILIDGISTRDLDRNSLRDNISVVTQQPYIFNYSVKDNLLLAKPSAKMSEIREACRLAHIDDYIMSLPKKYNTVLGEGGVILSGGQKQRLAIARALLMKTKIILFDEATSALDNKTQSEIQDAINELKGGYTLIIVAHRLSTIIDSDKIFVIEEGRLIDSGTHHELLRDCSLYRSLYNKDAKK